VAYSRTHSKHPPKMTQRWCGRCYLRMSESTLRLSTYIPMRVSFNSFWSSRDRHGTTKGFQNPKPYQRGKHASYSCRRYSDLGKRDKLERDVTFERDPCSECRHFESEKRICKIANISYNDIVYQRTLVLSRSGDDNDRTLLSSKTSELSKEGPKLAMPNSYVKSS
jgi:hypothetical protein